MIEVMDMLLPQNLPSAMAVSEWVAGTAAVESVLYQTSKDRALTHLASISAITDGLAALPHTQDRRVVVEGHGEDLVHDAFFHVCRVTGDPPAILIRMFLSARLTFLREVSEATVSLPNSRLEQIDRAFADCIACLAGGCANRACYVSEWEGQGIGVDGMTRWIRGHHVFAALTQGLILSLQALAKALGEGNIEEVGKWADLATALMEGSSATLELTGDFPGKTYEEVVRPSMMPPASAINLSGLMSIDHRFLVQMLRSLEPALQVLRERDPHRHAAMAAAFVEVYDSHIHVCSRFVGTKPSLLTEGRTSRSGPSLLTHFKTLRLKPFEQEPERHAERATSGSRSPCTHSG